MTRWPQNAIFYHIYPLGLLNAPQRNDFTAEPVTRLQALTGWLDHISRLGCNALYLGPVFESTTHGYDTADYYHVDRRLGTRQTLADFVRDAHQKGIQVVLDAVFNHTGRDFWAFRDVLQRRQDSPYRDWYSGMRFDRSNRYGDPFSYDTWAGHESLAKLNLQNPAVRDHLLKAVEHWIADYDIDGLRLDAADAFDLGFQQELASFCRARKTDFWLMGEVVHGDYRRWAHPGALDSTTNYEVYKGLYSSLNEKNYFEVAYAINRQWGADGIYRDLALYNFADNHDVNRVASQLKSPAYLYPLYALLYTMPGIPSVYYGSEFGIGGEKNGTDTPLRPALDLNSISAHAPQPDLVNTIQRLATIRHQQDALRFGSYQQLLVAPQQFIFIREWNGQRVLVALNAASETVEIDLPLPFEPKDWLEDVLNPGQGCTCVNRQTRLSLPPSWARILIL